LGGGRQQVFCQTQLHSTLWFMHLQMLEWWIKPLWHFEKLTG
jgi:hypothetical protein